MGQKAERKGIVTERTERWTWYLRRIRSMSGTEVAYRVEEQFKRAISRMHVPRFLPNGNRDGSLPSLPGLAGGVMTLARNEWLREQWREVADRAINRRFRLLGQNWPLMPIGPHWHIDPVTTKAWPAEKFCFDVNYRHVSEIGDIKYVWEINRLQYLQPISALAFSTGDQRLAELCGAEIESWIDYNPPFNGVNWASGIELALRIVSVLVVVSLVGDTGFTKEQRAKVWKTLSAHGYWLNRYPSRFSSANNHRIAEAGALFLIGTLVPSFADAGQWAAYGYAALEEEVSKQIYEDGVGVEQSPTYEAFIVEWLLLCGRVGALSGKAFSDAYWHRIARAGEFLRWITDVKGNQPRIGDDDEGRVFFSQTAPELYVSSVLSCLASVVERDDLVPPGSKPHLRDAYFGTSRATSQKLIGVRIFGTGGYTVVRSNARGAETLFIVDHGPVGYLSIAAHGHADTLSIWLHRAGQPVLVDAGTYLYHSGGGWRNHFRSTAAHNTLSIEGASSSEVAGPFNWSRTAKVTVLSARSEPTGWIINAEHDGFYRRFGVRHCRRVEGRSDGVVTIVDTLRGEGKEFAVEVGFVIHPDLIVEQAHGAWIVRQHGQAILRIEHYGCLAGRVQRGIKDTPRGWYSGSFGDKQPTSRLVFEGRMTTNESAEFVLVVV